MAAARSLLTAYRREVKQAGTHRSQANPPRTVFWCDGIGEVSPKVCAPTFDSILFLFLFDFIFMSVYIYFVMRKTNSKPKSTAVAKAKADKPAITAVAESNSLPPELLLEEAKKEPKRILLMDFISTIYTLRDEKKFTFRAIAEWFGQKGIETDHSAVYRTYLASIPPQQRLPNEDWSDADEPGYGDENVTVKKP
jgi:hypothetical protein